MQTNILIFGQLAEITNSNMITLEEAGTTDELIETIFESYPALSDIDFRIAVDKKVISENTVLHKDSQVALLPPFSGG